MAKPKPWFIKTRGSYLPRVWQAWLAYIPYIAYLVGVLVFVIKQKDSFWAAVFTLIPNWLAAGIVMTWFARRKS